MKVSEYIVKYFEEQKISHAFLIIGGFVAPLVDAFETNKKIKFICTTQEQGASMAAEAYSRISENLGLAISTSGPGATNMMTGIACAYFDSIPVVYLTGQVSRPDSLEKNGPRQIGFQETDVIKMVAPITKFAVKLDNPENIKYYLDQAVFMAKSGRPGPVLIDLPMDIQLSEIDPDKLKSYLPPELETDYDLLDKKIIKTIELINQAKRPVFILGAGVKIAKAKKQTVELIEKLGIPVVTSWGGIDVLPHNHPLFVEGFGVSANRTGNFAVQNADLIICLGSRLDTRQVGSNAKNFAREAKKVVVDIDQSELYKSRGLKIDVDINYDLNDFLKAFDKKIDRIKKYDYSAWLEKIRTWKEKYPIVQAIYYQQKDKVDPYVFMAALSQATMEGEIIIADTGNALSWTMQAFKVKNNQRLFSDLGHSSMGYSLVAAIGASFAANKAQVINIEGDGSFKMNINELETIALHQLPIKTFIMNNHGYGMIKQFQDVWFESRYKASSPSGGLGDSDLLKISEAFGIKTFQINNHHELNDKIQEVLSYSGPVVCSVEIDPAAKAIPKLEFGMPIEDTSPLLPFEELQENMIVESLERPAKKKTSK
ncbi:MAG: thiamine pyrophosphate-binding protein [Candidatus Buchananbacteria bacterium]